MLKYFLLKFFSKTFVHPLFMTELKNSIKSSLIYRKPEFWKESGFLDISQRIEIIADSFSAHDHIPRFLMYQIVK